MLSLSLCLIVRDEESELERLLPGVAGEVDEIIAVDTGSRDRTVSLLEEHGARVLHRPWDEDFAAARNAGLEQATGDWILVLDADEHLEPGTIAALRASAAAAPLAVWGLCVDFRNYSDDSRDLGWQRLDEAGSARWGRRGYYLTQVVRCFRNDPRIRYRGRIHELVEPAIEEGGGHLDSAGITLHHFLEERDDAEGRSKRERYLRLQERKAADEPHSAKAHWELGQQYLACGQLEAALAVLRQAWELAPANVEVGIHLALALLDAEQPVAALAVLDTLPDRTPRDARVEFQRGLAHVQLEKPEQARVHLEHAHAASPHLPQPLYWLARLGLDEDPAAARRHLTALEQLDPHFWPARLVRVELLAREGNTDAAVRAFSEAVDTRGEHTAPAGTGDEVATAEIARFLRELGGRRRSFRERLLGALATEPVHALPVAGALDALGEGDAALAVLEPLSGDPALLAKVGYRVGQLLVEANRLEDAANAFARLLRVLPSHVQALTDLAGILGNAGRIDDARELLASALAHEPDNALVHHNLSIAAFLSQPPRTELARRHAARAAELGKPLDPAAFTP